MTPRERADRKIPEKPRRLKPAAQVRRCGTLFHHRPPRGRFTTKEALSALDGIDLAATAPRLRGRFIVLDGPDGAGKTTQLKRLAESLEATGLDVVTCRDPGGTEIGDRIRAVLLDHDLTHMDPTCETLLFMASRAQLLGEVIRPALAADKAVLCDRFVSATCAYQGAAGFDPERVIDVARLAIGDTWPDLTIILDVDVDAGFSRIERRDGRGEADAMERRSLEFHRSVRELFLKLPGFYPAPVVITDGRGNVDTVHRRVLESLAHVAS